MKNEPTKLCRWLYSLHACPRERVRFGRFQTFDAAWKHLDKGISVWWLGVNALDLDVSWDGGLRLNDNAERLKRRIYRRVKAKYLAFKG